VYIILILYITKSLITLVTLIYYLNK